jgi:hypothetical protein
MDIQTDIWTDIVRALGSGGLTAVVLLIGYGLAVLWWGE